MSKKLRYRQCLPFAFIAFTFGCTGCTNTNNLLSTSSTTNLNSAEPNKLTEVVATTTVLCDFIKQIAQQTINLTCLIPPNIDPHRYQPKLEDSQAINQARIIFYNGYNLEPNLFKLIKESKNRAAKIAVAQRAVPKPLKYRKNGQIVPEPHVWHDTKNGMKMVEVITYNLSQIFPEHAPFYKSNAEKINKELTQLDTWIKSRIASIPLKNRQLVTSHTAMGYYAKAYNLSWINVLPTVKAKGEPTASQTKALFQVIRQVKAPKIFVETTINPSLLKNIPPQLQVKVFRRQLLVDGLATAGSEADTYQKMMTANTRTIVEGLGGTYLIFAPQVLKN
jgi:manganese/iron transport system substrate-binding protein